MELKIIEYSQFICLTWGLICLAWGVIFFIFIYNVLKILLSFRNERKKSNLDNAEKIKVRELDEPLRNLRLESERRKFDFLQLEKREEQLKYCFEKTDDEALKTAWLKELINLYK